MHHDAMIQTQTHEVLFFGVKGCTSLTFLAHIQPVYEWRCIAGQQSHAHGHAHGECCAQKGYGSGGPDLGGSAVAWQALCPPQCGGSLSGSCQVPHPCNAHSHGPPSERNPACFPPPWPQSNWLPRPQHTLTAALLSAHSLEGQVGATQTHTSLFLKKVRSPCTGRAQSEGYQHTIICTVNGTCRLRWLLPNLKKAAC